MRCEAIEIEARPRTAGLVCTGCGCTDDNACPRGCWWITYNPPLCSACSARTAGMLDTGELELRANGELGPGIYLNEADDAGDGRSGFFGAERCPASQVPALHAPIWIDATSGYCARCRQGFVT